MSVESFSDTHRYGRHGNAQFGVNSLKLSGDDPCLPFQHLRIGIGAEGRQTSYRAFCTVRQASIIYRRENPHLWLQNKHLRINGCVLKE